MLIDVSSLPAGEAGIGTTEYNTWGDQPTLPRMPTLDGPLALKPHGRADNPIIDNSHTPNNGETQADCVPLVHDARVWLFYKDTLKSRKRSVFTQYLPMLLTTRVM